METSPTISTKRFNRISDEIQASPSPTQPMQLDLPNPKILFPSFHTNVNQPAIITPHSQHQHTCLICRIKNIPCIFTDENKHAPDYTSAVLFRNKLIHRNCTPKLEDIKLKPINQTQPLNDDQKNAAIFMHLKTMPSSEKVRRYKALKKYKKINSQQQQQEQKQQQQEQKQHQQEHQQEQQQQQSSSSKQKQKQNEVENNTNDNTSDTTIDEDQPKSNIFSNNKTNPVFDWLLNFPITKEMEPNTKLQTPLSFQLFDFLKDYLHNFYPGKELKPATNNRKALKSSFFQLIRTMAGSKPQFLIDLIFQNNPNTNKEATIPFNILEATLKKIIHKFTTILFTKLNYAEIFSSSATIPPYKNQNRLQFCLNLARLHLYLSDNYQSINYKKFAEDLNLRPKRFQIRSATTNIDRDSQYVTIKSDNKFNIQLLFNIPKTNFLQKFNIPSLKNSLDHFDKWFESFFFLYNRQFDQPLDKQKVYNSLKYQIRQHFIIQLKLFLPSEFQFQEPTNLTTRRIECIRHANFHILTCSTMDCKFRNEQQQHNFTEILDDIFKRSYQLYPKKENETWKSPNIDATIFHIDEKYEASFKNPVPTKVLDELANQAEELTCKLNSTVTNTKRRNFYFYKYLSLYHTTAAENHNILNFDKQKAMEAITTTLIDTYYLARVITYYDFILNKTPSYPQVIKFFKEQAYPEAETYLNNKFKIVFTEPTLIEDSLFFQESSFQ
jgi:hypothetical protein